ncbi:lipopolysaccharide biosynthesis protein [Qipengyuania sediminis]|uniref:lipopolysaccharide biosynthesis protein n=1 Tax=Qipengyuania sediminis TaxID=1532023 RepID=UPI0010595867|nr:oligosaccharide flippase family protein [Qipengyuania sediminis]
MRLAARIPFLLIAGRLYGAESLGRFASALVIVELAAQLASLGEKRGLAQRLANAGEAHPANVVWEGMLLAATLSAGAMLLLWFLPAPLFPSGGYSDLDLLIVLAIPGFALTEILLAAQAYRFDVATTVRARALVEPWTISIAAGLFWLWEPTRAAGLGLAYLASIYAGLVTAFIPFLRHYGLPQALSLRPRGLARTVSRAAPLAAADAIEWGTRRLDLFILGLFAGPVVVGIYYAVQQVASLPQKLKTSFEPILGPVITGNLKTRDYAAIARHVSQVGFWIIAMQVGIALALGIPGEAVMGLLGPNFVGGTGALAFLLLAEVAAATAVIAEAVLIYIARVRNLIVSAATIALQGVLTVALILAFRDAGYPETYQAAGAAMALLVALSFASLLKARMASRLLGHRVSAFRWPLVWAAGPAVLVGHGATYLPEWLELAVGAPAILAVYGLVIWRRGFGPEDRALFRRAG